MVPAWTPDNLAETVWALRRLLRLGRQAGTITPGQSTTPTSAFAASIEEWLGSVEPVLKRAQGQPGDQTLSVPPFPLTGAQLDDLEREIQRARAEQAAQRDQRARRGANRWDLSLSLGSSLDHLHATLAAANHSSFLLIEAIAGLFALNTLYLLLLLAFHDQVALTTRIVALALGGNLVVIGAVAALWWVHHSHLHHHWHVLGWHTAMHGKRG